MSAADAEVAGLVEWLRSDDKFRPTEECFVAWAAAIDRLTATIPDGHNQRAEIAAAQKRSLTELQKHAGGKCGYDGMDCAICPSPWGCPLRHKVHD